MKGRRGRTIWVFEHDPLMKKMREKLSGAEGKKIYRGRKCTVEPALGNLAQNMGFRGFLLRTLRKVRGEFLLMCIAHNLKKIAGYVRRRRAERLGVQGLVAIPAQ